MDQLPSSDSVPTAVEQGFAAAQDTLVEWTAPIHPVHERSKRWYIIGALCVGALAVYGIATGTWTMTIAVLLIGGMYFLVRHEAAVLKHIAIQRSGYLYDGVFTRWEDCRHFWLIHTPAYSELHITKRRALAAPLVIQTADIDTTSLRSLLSQFLEVRSDQKERWMDIIIRLCKL